VAGLIGNNLWIIEKSCTTRWWNAHNREENMVNIQGKKILVTGAGGFIGSHLVEALVTRGAEVKTLVRYNSRNDWGMLKNIPSGIRGRLEVTRGDIIDSGVVRNAVKDCDIVFHLAALIGIPYSYVAPESYLDTNIRGTLNVMQASREEGVEKIVHTSTSEVYGTAKYVPIDEAHPLQGQSPYSASKIGADMLALSYFLSFNTPVAIIRPFNTFGPRQSARAVIPTIISQALSAPEIHIGSLEPVRDLTYVQDTVNGFIKVAESDNAIGEVINIGNGKGITIGELAKKILALMGCPDIPLHADEGRVRPEKSEVLQLVCNNVKAKTMIGWSPSVSLEQGLKETIAWIGQNKAMYKFTRYNL
jgi:NAD dependent epimerase/dehydratase